MKKSGSCIPPGFAFAALLFGLASSPAQSIYYVRPGATGANNGADWNNAYTSIPSSLVRGATYYLAAGNYGSPTFDDPDDGTNVIMILAATAASHGTSTGWNSSYAASETNQVLFLADVNINADYYTFSGQSRAGYTNGYNMKFRNWTDPGGWNIGIQKVPQYGISIKYCEFEGTHGTNETGGNWSAAIYGWDQINFYFGYNWVHDIGGDPISLNNSSPTENGGLNQIFENCWFYRDHESLDQAHGEAMQVTCSNLIVRYCYFQDIVSSGIITDATAQSPPMGGWQIYGNVFFWDHWWQTNNINIGIGDGVIGFFGEQYSGLFAFYNNTIYGITNLANGNGFASGIEYPQVASGATVQFYVYNNIWCQSPDPGMGGGTWNYNSYYEVGTGYTDGGSHSTYSNSVPFVNVNNYDFTLVADTAPGTSLAAPYNMDLNGVVRGADGVWDRGALQLAGGSITNPPAISNVQATATGPNAATVTWATDEEASSLVQYGLTTSYGNTVSNGTLVTSHSVALTALASSTTYHYRVQSANASNVVATSADATFATPAPYTNPPTISAVQATATRPNTATVTWTTDQGASSVVNYGLTPSYGSTASNGTLVTSHSVYLSSLAASTTYHYQVESVNVSNVVATSSDFTFTTSPPDTNPPTISVASPSAWTPIAGTTTLSANATDNAGIASVQFLVDGQAVGSPSTASPYSIAWNSTTVTNGPHSIQATALDNAGNTATSTGIVLQVNNQVSNGIVGYWTFDEGIGAQAGDSSGNGEVATLAGGAGWGQGVVGPSALLLDGSSSATVADAPPLEISGALSIALWVNHASLPGANEWMYYAEKGSGNSENYGVGVYGSTGGAWLFFEFYDSNGTYRYYTQSAGAALTTGHWTHVAVVFNKTAGQVTFYNNGQAVDSVAVPQSPAATTDPLLIGQQDINGYQFYMNGLIDDLRIYSRALSATEVSTLYHLPAPPPPVVHIVTVTGP